MAATVLVRKYQGKTAAWRERNWRRAIESEYEAAVKDGSADRSRRKRADQRPFQVRGTPLGVLGPDLYVQDVRRDLNAIMPPANVCQVLTPNA